MEYKENKFEQSHDYWIDTAQTLKRNLEQESLDNVDFDYPTALKAYEDAIDEIRARKSDYAGSPMLDDQATALLEEFEQKKKSFEDKLTQA